MRKIQLGGQAVIEGVMIRSPSGFAVSVQKPDGDIVVQYFPKKTKLKKFPFNLPIIRGIVAAYELLSISLKAIDFSSEVLGEKKESFMVPISIILFVLLFFGVPYFLTSLSGISHGSFLFHIVYGILKLLLFVGYLLFLRIFKDVRRFLSLHGAEHAVVNSYERGEKTSSTFHARCGTNFILIIIIVSVIIFSIFKATFFTRFLFLPLILSLSYELFFLFVKLNVMPSVLQFLTTISPSDDEIKVAEAALESVLSHEVAQE